MDNGITVHLDRLQDDYYVLALEVILPHENESPADHYLRLLEHRKRVDNAYLKFVTALFDNLPIATE